MMTSYLDLIYIFSFKEKASRKFYIDNLFYSQDKEPTIISSRQFFAGTQSLPYHETLKDWNHVSALYIYSKKTGN